MGRTRVSPAPGAHRDAGAEAWTAWVYAGLALLAGAQLLAGPWGSDVGRSALLPTLVGLVCFPLLALRAFRRSRERDRGRDRARDQDRARGSRPCRTLEGGPGPRGGPAPRAHEPGGGP
ncbi:hypothetical protein [Streptomyces sp. NPDC005805]|uniref:hypothetical protein n=1 Tax=Streptomyces sp. NPDC005805 TaxID=3157068 RepID=UPI0033D5CA24